jgi:hypothetical protein
MANCISVVIVPPRPPVMAHSTLVVKALLSPKILAMLPMFGPPSWAQAVALAKTAAAETALKMRFIISSAPSLTLKSSAK